MNTTSFFASTIFTTAAAAIALTAVAGCSASTEEVGAGEQHVESSAPAITPIATSARIELGMVKLREDIIVSEVATPGSDDIKPGFELELFAPTTLRPVAGLHGADGLALGAREMAIVNFAPVSAIARRAGGRQDSALYLDSSIDPSGLYMLPTERVADVAYSRGPGVAVTESVCDLGALVAEDSTPYPGLINAQELVDGEVRGAVLSLNAPGRIKIRLVAQVEHCAGRITSAAEAKAEPRLCYEKLVWLAANGGASTELGRLSGYRAPLSIAQTSYCGD